MATISYELPPSAFAALHLSPKEFAREMRVAACVQWYAQGLVSQERAAEIAGLSLRPRARGAETITAKGPSPSIKIEGTATTWPRSHPDVPTGHPLYYSRCAG